MLCGVLLSPNLSGQGVLAPRILVLTCAMVYHVDAGGNH